jgi:8-oxo-dGTP diphosphatase
MAPDVLTLLKSLVVAWFAMVVPSRTMPIHKDLPYRIAVLVFLENAAGEHLLIHRAKSPNLGAWSPIGGKLETATGESPFECAVRETREETGFAIGTSDLHLFSVIAEKAYEGNAHWLMFLFRCIKPLPGLPPDIAEGRFGFFARTAVDALPLPETDRTALWPIYDSHRERFVALRADCEPGRPVRIVVEQITPAPRSREDRA